MKHVFSISCAVFLSLLMLITSCKKGDTGPAGPAGPDGPAGPQGPKGDTGVANVIYSAWLDVKYDTVWNPTRDTIYGFVEDLAAPKLTNDILTRGEVKAYINWGTAATPVVDPLPLVDLFYGILIHTTFEAGHIYLTANDNYGTGLDGSSQKRQQYRYILIPGGRAARSSIDWNNYAAVKEYLKLPD